MAPTAVESSGSGAQVASAIKSEITEGNPKLPIYGNHRFPVNSKLGFLTYIYNVERTSQPDVALQIQVLRDDQPVFTKPLVKVDTTGVSDATRIPYGEDLDLRSLPAGNYILQITAIDRVAKKTATQHTRFFIN